MKILRYPNQLLVEKCSEIETLTPEVKETLKELGETLDSCDGVGLAAPQVGVLLRAFAIQPFKETKPEIWVNPTINSVSGKWDNYEGCLSIPGVKAKVTRYFALKIEGLDASGNYKSKKVSGWEAVIIQHELDHLNGVLFIDHIPKIIKKQLLRKYSKLTRKL